MSYYSFYQTFSRMLQYNVYFFETLNTFAQTIDYGSQTVFSFALLYSFSQLVLYISHNRIKILKSCCSICTSCCYPCTSKSQFLIVFSKLQMLLSTHANGCVQFSFFCTLSIGFVMVTKILCHDNL